MYAVRQNRIHVSNKESPLQRELSLLLHLLPLLSTSASRPAVLVLSSTSLHMLLTVPDSPDPLHVPEGTYSTVL
jgi:hypothetical protein